MKLVTRLLTSLVALAATSSLASAAVTTWKIDPAHTEVGFEVRHFFAKVHGVFHDVSGTIVFDEADSSAVKVEASVRVSSVDTGNKNRDSDLRGPDFFDGEKDSTLSFRSTKAVPAGKNKFKITGDLTMRGVTRPVTFDAEYLGSAAVSIEGRSWGTKAGFSATTVVNRKDWGINWNQALDNGGMMVGDDVTIELNIEASKVQ